jgi:type I restriction enzyme R subunit
MPAKEARARIKINKLLEAAGWRFLDDASGRVNIALELNVKLTTDDINELGEDFESISNGYVDFLLLDDNGAPLVVLEAKAESKNQLVGKEQARKYHHKQCRKRSWRRSRATRKSSMAPAPSSTTTAPTSPSILTGR